jgi:hypothetical protein
VPDQLNAAGTAAVVGHIVGAAITPAARAPLDSLTVMVAGTTLCAPIDRFGRFALFGVPPGTVRLQFTGPDVDAAVVIPAVEPRDQVHVGLKLFVQCAAASGW